MKLFLSSKGLATEELIERFISFNDQRKGIQIITTAAHAYKELNRNNIELKEKLEYLGFKSSFIDIEYEDPALLKNAELIIINGGNPYYLLYQMKRTKSDQVLKELIESQIPVKGISAGGLVLMNSLKIIDALTPELNTIQLKDKWGLDLIEELVVPHYDRFVNEGKIIKGKLDKFELESSREVVRLGEYQCLLYSGGTKEIYGELIA